MKFVFVQDRKRAMASRLFSRRVATAILGMEFSEVKIKRTKGRKPFIANPPSPSSNAVRKACPNLNYNISHEVGDYSASWDTFARRPSRRRTFRHGVRGFKSLLY